VHHPEIEEFLEIRKPSGDFNRKSLNLHHGVNVTDEFMLAVRDDKDFGLRSPKTGEVLRTISARKLWQKILDVRLATGELIDATPVNIRAVGQQTLVSIRPERVEFKPEMMPPGIHTLKAEVLEFIYMGDIFRTRMRVAGSEDFVMKCRNTIGQRKLTPGERIEIAWHAEDARALDPM